MPPELSKQLPDMGRVGPEPRIVRKNAQRARHGIRMGIGHSHDGGDSGNAASSRLLLDYGLHAKSTFNLRPPETLTPRRGGNHLLYGLHGSQLPSRAA